MIVISGRSLRRCYIRFTLVSVFLQIGWVAARRLDFLPHLQQLVHPLLPATIFAECKEQIALLDLLGTSAADSALPLAGCGVYGIAGSMGAAKRDVGKSAGA